MEEEEEGSLCGERLFICGGGLVVGTSGVSCRRDNRPIGRDAIRSSERFKIFSEALIACPYKAKIIKNPFPFFSRTYKER